MSLTAKEAHKFHLLFCDLAGYLQSINNINSESWQLCLQIYKVLLITWWKKLGVALPLSFAFMRLKAFVWSPFKLSKSLETTDWSNSNLCRVWQWVNYQNYAKLNFEKTTLAFWIVVCYECIYRQAYASYLSTSWLIFDDVST